MAVGLPTVVAVASRFTVTVNEPLTALEPAVALRTGGTPVGLVTVADFAIKVLWSISREVALRSVDILLLMAFRAPSRFCRLVCRAWALVICCWSLDRRAVMIELTFCPETRPPNETVTLIVDLPYRRNKRNHTKG